MSLRMLLAAGVAVLALVPTIGHAQVESGPVAGAKLAALKVTAATGEFTGEDVDYAEKRKDKPTVYAFVQADTWDRPMARYLKTLDAAVKKAGGDAQVVAVWLTGDAEKSKEYLPKAQNSLKLELTALVVYAGDKSGPENWGINDRARLTTVVTDGETCAARFGYVSLNETDVPAVEKALKEVLEKAEKKTE
ncbi:MAG: hypothetical protein WD875_15710 [Pirellulales bacterium]